MITHLKPPIPNKLKAHWFDRYALAFEGSKLLSSVGDQDQGRPVQLGRCYDFDGADDFINLSKVIPFSSSSFTVEFWVNYSSFYDFSDPFGLEFVISFVTYADASVKAFLSGGNGSWDSVVATPPGTLTANRWYHYALTYNGINTEFFIDGISKGTAPFMGIVPDATPVIGARRRLNTFETLYYFMGKINGLKFWNKPLTLREIQDNIQSPVVNDSSIVGQWKMDESAGAMSYDSSGNGNHGTINNATLSTFHSTQDLHSFQNEVGYGIDEVNYPNILIPAKTDTLDIFNNPLTHRGQVAYNGLLKQSNCIQLDGVDDYISLVNGINTQYFDSVEWQGTSMLTLDLVNLKITGTAGTVYDLKIKDSQGNVVSHMPCAEGAYLALVDVSGYSNWGALVNTSQSVWQKQGNYHYNIQNGFETWRHNTDPVANPDILSPGGFSWGGYTKISTNRAGRHHNGAETQIDFSGGVAHPLAVKKALPTAYKFGDAITYKEAANNKEKNILMYDNPTAGEITKIKNFTKQP